MDKRPKVRQWAAEQLAVLLQLQPTECGEIVENILDYDDPGELQDFLGGFVEDASMEYKVKSFVRELFVRREGGPPAPAPTNGKGGTGKEYSVIGGKGGGNGKDASGKDDGFGRGAVRNKDRDRDRNREDPGPRREGTFSEGMKLAMPFHAKAGNDKRLMVIDSASGRHKVLTNCLNCGKVIAETEGWAPCLFCGNPLEVGDNFGLKRGDDRGFVTPYGDPSKEEEKLNAGFEAAKATKDRLLSYDRNNKKQTKVFDDATDWYSESVNPWLNERQRDEALRLGNKEEQRQRDEKRKIHARLDLFGRTFVLNDAEVLEEKKKEDKQIFEDWNEKVVDEQRGVKKPVELGQRYTGGSSAQLAEDSVDLFSRLRASLHASSKDVQQRSGFAFSNVDVDEGGGDVSLRKKSTRYAVGEGNRSEAGVGLSVDDFETAAKPTVDMLVEEASPYGDDEDPGACLSMQQPWASLTLHGLRRAECRSWRAEYRGRLWIHALGREPEDLEIDIEEQKCRSLFETQNIPAPSLPSEGAGYPTNALLGCVDLDTCWTSQEFGRVLADTPAMPQEPNDSEYVFWCVRPRRLAVPVRMGGDQKIWRLPRSLLQAAQRGLQPVYWPAPNLAKGERTLGGPSLPPRPAGSPAAMPFTAEEPDALEKPVDANRGTKSSSGSTSVAPATKTGGANKIGATGKKPKAATLPRVTEVAAEALEAPPPPHVVGSGFDLWPPTSASGERLQGVVRDDSTDRDIVVLQNGFVHLVGFIPLDLQQRLIDAMREPGLSERGFDERHLELEGAKASQGILRMYLGLGWDPASRTWVADGAAGALPKDFAGIFGEAVKRANRELQRAQHRKRKIAAFSEAVLQPSHAVATFCPILCKLSPHQARCGAESKSSVDAGLPIVGACFGDACELAYCSEAPEQMRTRPKVLRLESGDVFILGHEARLLWHGVQRVVPRSAPVSLRLATGHLGVTLRVQ